MRRTHFFPPRARLVRVLGLDMADIDYESYPSSRERCSLGLRYPGLGDPLSFPSVGLDTTHEMSHELGQNNGSFGGPAGFRLYQGCSLAQSFGTMSDSNDQIGCTVKVPSRYQVAARIEIEFMVTTRGTMEQNLYETDWPDLSVTQAGPSY